jgi:FtsP/CotA-like multicopper oxidase with cupredoxin domain
VQSNTNPAGDAAPPTADPAIAGIEAARPHTGRTVTATLTPQPVTVDLGGPRSNPGLRLAIPAPTIRARVGDELAVTVANGLDHTSVHWHGIALRNDMDCADPATTTSHPALPSPNGI